MRPLAIVTFALVCSFPRTASAQEASADVSATVEQDLVIASEGETNFGSVGNFAHTENIDPREPTATQSTALFTVSASAPMTLSCPNQITLNGPGDAQMTFDALLAVSGFAEGRSTSVLHDCPSFTLENTSLWLWLGGTLFVSAGQATGAYTGVFTLTAAYQ